MASNVPNVQDVRPSSGAMPSGERQPDDPPREMTKRARRRSWTEPSVRFWWASALVLFAAGLYFSIDQLRTNASESWLLTHGVEVQGKVATADGEPVSGKNRPPESVCELSYEFGGQTYKVAGRLAGREQWIVVGSMVPLHIDPADPQRWTGRTGAMKSSSEDWLAPIIIFPIAIIVLAIAYLKRNRLASVWRRGEAIPAIVLDSRHTALAPRSRSVRLAPADSDDRRIYTVFVPRSAPTEEGQRLWLLIPPSGRGPVAAARWFE